MRRLASFVLFLMLCNVLVAQQSADSIIFDDFLRYAAREKLEKKPAGERVALVGRFFLGSPYVAFTLEAPGPERLQVNLHGLDCTTLVENALALSRLSVSEKKDFETYKAILSTIRYRNGKLNGYASRLHYASDWLSDNSKKGFVSLLRMSGMESFRPSVNYMSTHPSAYPALKADSSLLPIIVAQEADINYSVFPLLPKEKLKECAPFIHNGDIIAISTKLPGLDFAHLGIAVRQKGKVYLLHASSTGKKVLISETPLSEYLLGVKKHSGIVVVRPL